MRRRRKRARRRAPRFITSSDCFRRTCRTYDADKCSRTYDAYDATTTDAAAPDKDEKDC